MNYQKKYYFSFKDINNVSYTVEIWQDTTATVNPIEVTGAVQPFVIEYATLDNKVNPVHGSGATINMIATVNNSFIDLYTGKIKEFLVKCFRGASLIWCGYLDSETYEVDFAQYDNYEVSFTCSDGFALLERINYIDNNTLLPYTGICSQWSVLTNVLSKMNLPINNVFIALSTVSNDFAIAYNETIFHKTLVINDNYVNETNEPETSRKVLEGILQPYGAFIVQVNGSIWVTDLNFIANNDVQTLKKFNPDCTYSDSYSINLNIGDLSTIGFMSDSAPLSIVSALNKIVVSYSNYKGVDLIDTKQDDFKTPSAPGAVKGLTGYQWTETVNGSCGTWIKSGNGRFVTLNGVAPQTDTDNYLSTGATTNKDLLVSKSFTYSKQLPYIIPTNDFKLKINISAYFRSTDNLNKDSDSTKQIFKAGRIMARLKIGNKYLTSKGLGDVNYPALYGNRWTTTNDLTVANNLAFYFYNASATSNILTLTYNDIADQWIEFNDITFNGVKGIQTNDYLVSLYGMTGGLMTLEIYDAMVWGWDQYGFSVNPGGNFLTLKEVRIKDVKFTVVDASGKELSISDTEYFSALDPAFKDDYKIELIHGTNVSKCPIEKGSLLFQGSTQYEFCQSWSRNGQTAILEKLLQNTVKSNYLNPSIQLVCTTNSLPSLIGVVHYQSQLPGKSFMISSARINLEDNATELTLQEVSKDILTVL